MSARRKRGLPIAVGLLVGAAALANVGPAGAAPLSITRPAAEGCEWLAGDLHVHTTYSHDSYGGPHDDNTEHDEFYTFGWGVGDEGLLGASRGLDYVAITDHDDIRSQQDFAAISRHGVIPVPGYEKSLAAHVQMLGATRIYDKGASSLADVERIAEELRADGGVFQINHPADGHWVANYGFSLVPDAIEIWNIGVWAYEPPMPATDDHEYPLRFYDDYLKDGHRIAATGGSDSHWRSTTAVQGVGQPTTWVCSESRTHEGILNGIEAGRTTISHQPPAYAGPFLELQADTDRDGSYESMLGDAVPPGTPVRALVTGAEGAHLRLVTNVGTEQVLVGSHDFTHETELPEEAVFVRAEVFYEDAQNPRSEQQAICSALEPLIQHLDDDATVSYCHSRLAVVALSSPIYFETAEVDRSTTLVYDGDSSARAGDTATFAATLTGAEGPLSGKIVDFAYRGATYRATTDEAGRALVAVRIVGPPGNYEVASSFAGDEEHEPSQDVDPFEVTAGP